MRGLHGNVSFIIIRLKIFFKCSPWFLITPHFKSLINACKVSGGQTNEHAWTKNGRKCR